MAHTSAEVLSAPSDHSEQTVAKTPQVDREIRKVQQVSAHLQVRARPESSSPARTFIDTQRESIEELNSEHHRLALTQARVQFWCSIAAATVGVAGIVYAGWHAHLKDLLTAPTLVPGVLINGVVILFLRQASATRRRATELLDRLRQDTERLRQETQLKESMDAANSIEDLGLRSVAKTQIALKMAGIPLSPIDLKSFISKPDPSSSERDQSSHSALR